MIVAVAALSIAVGGSAVAASDIFSKPETKLIKKFSRKQANNRIKKKAPRIADAVVTRRAPSLDVNSSDTANSALTADTANTANSALTANSASPTGSAGGELTGSYPNPQIADEAKPMWALIDADREIVDQSGGISVETASSNGFTRLRFPRPVQERAILATVTLGNAFGTPLGEPGIKANACGSADAGPDCASGGNANTQVVVAPFINDVQAAVGFYVAAFP